MHAVRVLDLVNLFPGIPLPFFGFFIINQENPGLLKDGELQPKSKIPKYRCVLEASQKPIMFIILKGLGMMSNSLENLNQL